MDRQIVWDTDLVKSMCHDRGGQHTKYSVEATFYVDRIHEHNGKNNKMECLHYDAELSNEHGGPVLIGDHYDSIQIPSTQYRSDPNRVHSWVMYKYKQAESLWGKETMCASSGTFDADD